MRALAVLTVALFVAALSALGIFIVREIDTEHRVTVAQKIGSPCRTAKQEALNARGTGSYWGAIRTALMDNECAEQSDLVLWSYCVRHHTTTGPICSTLPGPLRALIGPDRPPDDGDREGGDAGSPNNQGHGQPPPGPDTGSGGSPGIGIPHGPPGGSQSPPASPLEEITDEVTHTVCESWDELMPPQLPDPLAPLVCP